MSSAAVRRWRRASRRRISSAISTGSPAVRSRRRSQWTGRSPCSGNEAPTRRSTSSPWRAAGTPPWGPHPPSGPPSSSTARFRSPRSSAAKAGSRPSPGSGVGDAEGRIVTGVEGLARSGFTDDLETYLDEFGDALGRLPGHAGTDVVRLARGARLLAHGANQPLAALLLDASLSRVAESPQGISDWARELLATDGSPWPVAELPATHWGEALGDLVDVAPAA